MIEVKFGSYVHSVVFKKCLLGIMVIFLCTFLVSCDNTPDKEGTEEVKSEVAQIKIDLPFELTEPIHNIDPAHIFSFRFDYDPEKIEGYNIRDGYSHAIAVYCEPSFTIEAKDAFIYYIPTKSTIYISPDKFGLQGGGLDYDDFIQFTKPDEWGFHDEYYIVQKLDPKTGEKLEKPLVTRFTVQTKVDKPVFSFSVDNKGIGHFSWSPLESAVKYYILSIEKDREYISILGETTKTEWTTAEQDKRLQRDLKNGKVYLQNNHFRNFRFSEDDEHSKDYLEFITLQKITNKYFGVIAETNDGFSSISFIDGDTIIRTLPIQKATNAAKELKADDSNVNTFDDIPPCMPITMGDGSTVLRPVVIDVDNVKIEKQTISYLNKEGQTSTETFDACVIPYVIENTMLNGKYKIRNFDENTYRDEIQRISTRNIESQVKTGGETVAFTYSSEKYDMDSLSISRVTPDVPYKVNATNPFTHYLAANMIEGNEFIDVSEYLNNAEGIDIYDALFEAIYQNPYILNVKTTKYINNNKLLRVYYNVPLKEELIKEQKAISDEVDRIISKIISPGMSDEQKVKAINDYIIRTGSYDFDALNAKSKGKQDDFKHAWTPAGILLHKKAVCGGYAKAFKVLADKADIESVYVTGFTNGELHAWNKVKVNGVWRVIDTTWNDTEVEPNRYYLLTDNQASKTRTQDNYFVIDALISNYEAN